MSFNMESFTDVLGDEICDSQPMSWPSSGMSDAELQTVNITEQVPINRPVKRTGQYGEFRSIEEIDPKYRNVFSYQFFNRVQSNVIEDALYSDKSIVVCAPTGSGKTVVFEMAIVQLLMEIDDKNYTGDFKIIYMAPVKALCTERLSEWYPKFTKLGLLCIEVTGDTDVDFSQLKPYRIIITTPEKWDMLTRRWRDHKGLVEVIKLFLIDEVHILNDESRGPVLEAVVSRMKTIESSAQSDHRIEQLKKQFQGNECVAELVAPPRIRFVAVSATVSNPEDVANWLSNNDKPAVYHKYGDECRPVKLKRVVEGYPCTAGTSIFKFDIILNYKLWPIIQKYHDGKPTLIFCNTRKSVLLTAETLSRELTISFNPEQKAKLAAIASTIKNKKLQSLVLNGVGCHHAGLLFEERMNIEHAFRNRDLPILITTTTLAMGVNLPAHLVIVKNTQQYVNGAYQEYSISTVLQMVGRAGRPQFDTEATAVIMTRLIDKPRYQALVGGSEPLQSFLHKRLPENLNSEAALGTVSDVAQCVQWLRSTFLYVRAARDPKRYLGLPPNAPQHQISKKIEELCVKAMNGLASSGLITMDEASCIESTEAGRLMSIFYLDLQTMRHIMKINGTENLEELLRTVCESHELADMHLRIDERRCLNTLNRNNAAATIRFPMKGKINTRQMKLNCIIQAVLGCLPIPDPSLNQEAMKIIRIADRVCKCLVAYVTRPDLISQKPQYFSAVLNSLILAKCMAARLWENSRYVSKQLKGIGPTFSTLLATAGKINFSLLEESNPRDLERIMNKAPPSGNVLRKQISLLPKYQLLSTSIDEHTVSIRLFLLNQTHMSENMDQLTAGDAHKSYVIVGDSNNNILLLTTFKDRDLINVYDGCITYKISRIHNFEHKIFAHCISSNFVGIDANCEHIFQNLDSDLGFPHPQVNMFEVATTKKTAKKQTSITDAYKERKRKNSSGSEISQSKEKKKRESALIEKFKFLKESFGITSKELKEDLHRSEAMSNKILKDFTPLKKPSSRNINPTENNVPKNTVNNNISTHVNRIKEFDGVNIDEINLDDIDSDEFMDDDKINNILNTIESEISEGPNKSSNISFQSFTALNSVYFNENTNKSKNTINTFQTRKRKPINAKSNYNFIELLEKNADLSDDERKEHNKKDTGFSNAIKDQIATYFKKTHDSAYRTNNTINDLLNNNSHDFVEIVKKPQSVSTEVIQLENQSDINETVEKNGINIQIENKSLLNSVQRNDIDENIEGTDKCVNEYSVNTANDNISCHGSYPTEKSIPTYMILHKNQPEIHETLLENVKNTQTENKSLLKSVQRNDIDGNIVDTDKCVNEYLVNSANDNISCHGSHDIEKSILTDVIIHNNQLDIHETLTENVENVKTEHKSLLKSVQGNYIDENIKDTDKCVNKYLDNTENDNISCNSYVTKNSIIRDCNDVVNECSIKPSYLAKNEDNYLANDKPPIDDTYDKKFDTNNDLVMNTYSDIRNLYKNALFANEKPNMEIISFENKTAKRNNIPEKSSNERLSSNSYCSVYDQNESKHSSGRNPFIINKYSHTSTKIDVTTNDMPQHHIRVIRKLKIDLNITEVVSKEKTMKNCTKQKGLRTRNEYSTKYINHQGPQSIESYTPSQSHEKTNNRKELAIQYPSANFQIEQGLERSNFTEPDKCLDFNALICKNNNTKDNDNGNNQSEKYLIDPINNNQRAQNIKKLAKENCDGSCHNKDDERIVTNETASESGNDLDNILKKYSNLFRNKSAKDIIHTQIGNKDSREKIQIDKPKRPFKISNIDNLSTPLPNTLISQYKSKIPTFTLSTITANKPEPQQDVVNKDSSDDDSSIPEYQSLMDENICITNTSVDYNIDQTMFNPKTLLQCFIEDDQELIPPPPQFCDVTANYSPEYIGFKDTSNPIVNYDLSDWQDNSTNDTFYEAPQEISIFDDISHQLNLTPTKEIETWTLSKDSCDDSNLYQNHNKSCTVVNEKFSKNRHGSFVKSSSSKSKLSQFKFNHKTKMKM